MFVLTGIQRDYPWGSAAAIAEFIGVQATGRPLAELWFGAHASGAAGLGQGREDLAEYIAADPRAVLGEYVHSRFGPTLPYLFKVLAPAAPLSMQVHPSLEQARAGYARARAGGPWAPIDYVDANHKPELLYPLTDFEALAGFRPPAQARTLLAGLGHPSLAPVRAALSGTGRMREAFTEVLALTPAAVGEIVAAATARRVAGESPEPEADDVLADLDRAFPGDPGVVASLLLTPRRLAPGEAMFIPPGVVHMYLRGLGVEIMANSDNVLRAGLTPKHVDVTELLRVLDPTRTATLPAPRPAGPGVRVYADLVADFELTHVEAAATVVTVPGSGPRIILALGEGVDVRVERPDPTTPGHAHLRRGQAVFVADFEGPVQLTGGPALQAAVPVPGR